MKRTIAVMASALAITLLGHVANAAIITTLNEGDDWTLHRTNSTAENRILVKNSSNQNNDRIGVAKFSGPTPLFAEPVTAASVRFDIERTAASNNFNVGDTIELWGIPDGHADEAIVQSNTFGSLTNIVGDTDGTDNLLLDANLAFLGSITFAADTTGDVLDFIGAAVTSFVQADTNNTLTFLLTLQGGSSDSDTVLIFNENSTADSTQFYPSVMTNGDAVVPEPSTIALAGLAGFALVALGRRSS